MLLNIIAIAIKFADLHDTPGRMKAKGAIDAVVDWEQARPFFYYRLKFVHSQSLSPHIQYAYTYNRRRIAEINLRKSLMKADPLLDPSAATQLVAQFKKENIPAAESSKEQPWKAGLWLEEMA